VAKIMRCDCGHVAREKSDRELVVNVQDPGIEGIPEGCE
jgi:hypothetical protein